jgi:predicted dehydrogenase/threonine dehydrogenase-like Zn-dependent dehydrogenase
VKQVLFQEGRAVVEDVPAPLVEPGTILVRTFSTCISAGTELSGIHASGTPLWKKALKNPDKVIKTLKQSMTHGLTQTQADVFGRLAAGQPTGYSAAGEVIEVGSGILDIHVGDRVACAGAQCAFHAELIRIPRNLAVPIPKNLSLPFASTVTLGAIALQGVRRAQPTLGETFVVLGLGILGQLTVQFLRANGCRVIGLDKDTSRVQLALSLGMDASVDVDDESPTDQIIRLTGGIGADGVIITAASPSNEIISSAFRMCRKKGRAVLVGDVGLALNRADFYQKEIDFLISTSYGPGRYDRRYEEEGADYPISYVRWTENRNMEEYLRLLAEGKVNLEPLISAQFPIEQATTAYESFGVLPRPLMVLLQYTAPVGQPPGSHRISNPMAAPAKGEGPIRLGLVGAGGFAKSMHLPNIASMPKNFSLRAVASRSGHNATATARRFGATFSTTRYQELLADPEIDAILIATRHNLHCEMALQALEAGKHVLLEKPLALSEPELVRIRTFYEGGTESSAPPLLLTGFNRRYSPLIVEISEALRKRSGPILIQYTMNAGYIPLEHWVHTSEGGGRNLGEACHIYDLFTFLTGARSLQIKAACLNPPSGHYSHRDNFQATISFDDGSLASLSYTSMGHPGVPKERMEVFSDGKVYEMIDYQSLVFHGSKRGKIEFSGPRKGQKEELEAFGDAIRKGGQWPAPLWQQIQATEIALAVDAQLFPPSS